MTDCSVWPGCGTSLRTSSYIVYHSSSCFSSTGWFCTSVCYWWETCVLKLVVTVVIDSCLHDNTNALDSHFHFHLRSLWCFMY